MGTKFQLLSACARVEQSFSLGVPAEQKDLCLVTLLLLLIALTARERPPLSMSYPPFGIEGWKLGFNLCLLLKFSI